MSCVQYLLSNAEQFAYAFLAAQAKLLGIDVCIKVRLGDVIDLRRSGLANDEFEYACKAHLDFVLAREWRPLVAIECDFTGKTWRTKMHSDLKDSICSILGLDLVRLNCRHMENAEIAESLQSVVVHYCDRRGRSARPINVFDSDKNTDSIISIQPPANSMVAEPPPPPFGHQGFTERRVAYSCQNRSTT